MENVNFVILDKDKFQIFDFDGEQAKYGILKFQKNSETHAKEIMLILH